MGAPNDGMAAINSSGEGALASVVLIQPCALWIRRACRISCSIKTDGDPFVCAVSMRNVICTYTFVQSIDTALRVLSIRLMFHDFSRSKHELPSVGRNWEGRSGEEDKPLMLAAPPIGRSQNL